MMTGTLGFLVVVLFIFFLIYGIAFFVGFTDRINWSMPSIKILDPEEYFDLGVRIAEKINEYKRNKKIDSDLKKVRVKL